MLRIARELEKREYGDTTRKYESYEVEYLLRKEGDTLFRSASFEEKLPRFHEVRHTLDRTALNEEIIAISKELLKTMEKEISL